MLLRTTACREKATSQCSERFARPSEVDPVVCRRRLSRFVHIFLALTKIEHHTVRDWPHLGAYAPRIIFVRALGFVWKQDNISVVFVILLNVG